MATLQRVQPEEGSVWAQMRHAIGAVCHRGGAILTGQYVYEFTNSTGRIVKMHIVADWQLGACLSSQDYFLTMPAHMARMELPMTSSNIIVTAGFYNGPEENAYEIFWERRPFAWEPSAMIAILPRHSVDSNRCRADVLMPGRMAEAVPSLVSGMAAVYRPDYMAQQQAAEAAWGPRRKAELLMLPPVGDEGGRPALPDAATRVGSIAPKDCSGDGIARFPIYTLTGDGWRCVEIISMAIDGTLEVEDGDGQVRTVKPESEATLLPLLPWAKQPLGASQNSCLAGQEGPTREQCSEVVSLGGLTSQTSQTATSTVTTLAGSIGQTLEYYSENKGCWLGGEIVRVCADGSVVLQSGASKTQRTIGIRELAAARIATI
mmetsp:Transcript_104863/g.224098  ORF Transcript_104863/g.224098 Transcript_104863/m.224098 type:complete len:376 (-) Transcript_104863:90-1217(-)